MQRELDAVVADLLGPLLSAKPRDGWRLLGWDAEQGIQFSLGRGRSVLLIELEPRDESRECCARTRLFNVCARLAFSGTKPLGPAERSLLARAVAVVRARENRLPSLERSASARKSLVREIEVPRLLIPEGAGHYYINPYAGCTIGCAFCYVAVRADLSRSLEGLPALPWGRYVDVKVNAAEVLRREVRRRRPGVVRLSPILTDPYQPLERRYRITRACLEVLLPAGFLPVILTRAALVQEDLELLRRFRRAAVGFSIPTDDDRVRQKFEPGADPILERLAALERCRRAGLRTFAVVQPMLPMDPGRLASLLAPLVDAVRVDRMHELPRVQGLYAAAGLAEASREAFFAETGRALRAAFAARAIPYDELDDLAGVLGLRP